MFTPLGVESSKMDARNAKRPRKDVEPGSVQQDNLINAQNNMTSTPKNADSISKDGQKSKPGHSSLPLEYIKMEIPPTPQKDLHKLLEKPLSPSFNPLPGNPWHHS